MQDSQNTNGPAEGDKNDAPNGTTPPNPDEAPKPGPAAPKNGDTPGDLTAAERAELERLRKIHADEARWEKRNKANIAKLRELAESMGIDRSEFNPAEFDPKSAFEQLRAEIEHERTERARVEVASAAGVPTELVLGNTREEMQAHVEKILSWAKVYANKAPADKRQELPDASEVKGGQEIKGERKVSAAEYAAITDPAERRRLRESGLVEGFGAPKKR